MHPYLFHIPLPWGGSFPVASYGTMILIGYLVSLWIGQRRGRRMGLDPLAMFDLFIVVLFAGIVGARLFYVIEDWGTFAEHPWRIIRLDQGGLSFFGGLMAGLAGLLVSIWKKGMPLRPTLDALVSVVPLGHAFGRIGCFLNGCCFGKVSDAWIAIRFPRVLGEGGRIVGCPVFIHHLEQGLVTAADKWSESVYPTQLYAVAYNFAIFALLSYLLWRRWRAGEIAWLYAIFYGTARYINEIFRVNPPIPQLGGMTIFQVLSFALVIFGFAMFLRGRLRPYEPLPEPWRPPPERRERS